MYNLYSAEVGGKTPTGFSGAEPFPVSLFHRGF